MTDFGFDPTTYAPSQSFEPIKPGWYAVTIIEASMRETQFGHHALALTYEVDVDDHPDVGSRKLFDNLNINHPNDKPREISRGNLAAICLATGLSAQRTDDLLGGRMAVKVTVKPSEGQYEARNEVKGYRSMDADGDRKPAPVAPASKPTAAARPWKR